MERKTSTTAPTLHDVLAASLTGPLRADHHLAQQASPQASDEALYAACNHVQDAHHHGKQWQWSEAEAALSRAYAALGAVNPGTGADWHAGRHPVQQSPWHPLSEDRGAQG